MTISMQGLDLSGIVWSPIRKGRRKTPPDRRSLLAGPQIISDCMESTMNHANGKRYDSKSNFRKAVRAAGCDIVGNDTLPQRKPFEPVGVKDDIRRAISELS